MKVTQTVPFNADVDLDACLAQLTGTFVPFAAELVDCCSMLSASMMADFEARRFPEIQALAFWLRKTSVLRMKRSFEELQSADCILVPRGITFHIPPGNVDTIMVYSWALSFLTGNVSVIRLSDRKSAQSAILVRLFRNVLEQCRSRFNRNTVFLEYGHDGAITAEISARADVRIIWGGDETIQRIRKAPVPPHAKDLAFPDRFSLAVFESSVWSSLPESSQRVIVERFYNDTYWFNQMACSSPRALVWCGTGDLCAEASRRFLLYLKEHIRAKGAALPTGAYLNKLAFAYGTILDMDGECGYFAPLNELTVLNLKDLHDLTRRHCGSGLLYQVFISELDDLVGVIERCDQTLSTFGFDESGLRRFARQLNGKGIDRIVPVGSALEFSRFWDGYDLFQELTRRVHIADVANSV